ncbi:MAG: heme o synthase [Planctomycetota bacterium]
MTLLDTAAIPISDETPRRRTRAASWSALTKPRLNLLVLITAAAGFYFAGGTDWLVALHLLIGTAATAASASVLNQLWERDIDALMPRTKRRPLPNGEIAPREALLGGLLLGIGGTVYLALLVNILTAGLALATVLLYVLIYTPLKTRTTWCTLVGAIPGAVPPVMGVTAATSAINLHALSVFALLFAWQMPHFWGLAIMYRRDYAAAGMKMLPVVDGPVLKRTVRSIIVWSVVLLVAGLLPWFLGQTVGIYLAPAALLGGVMLAAGFNVAASPQRREARVLFLTSIVYLPIMLLLMLASVE